MALRRFLVRILLLLIVHTNAMALPDRISGVDLRTGKQVSVKFSDAKLATALVFLSVKCPCSNSHQPVLDKLFGEFRGKGIQFVGVHSNADEKLEMAQNHFGSNKLSFPVIQDNKTSLADQLGAYKTPHVFVISPKSEVLFQGGVDNSKTASKADKFYLREALAAILQGKKPPQKEVRVLGCEIKRS